MPKRITPISDIQIKNAKPQEQDYKLTEGFGLFLLVTPSGGKLWRFDYRFGGKRKIPALGAYPAVTNNLSEVREATYWWRNDYNELRPHDSLGYMTPAEYMENYIRNSTLNLFT